MLWIILATLLFQMETEADIETGTVVIDVVGLESDQGQVVAVLFSQGEWGFPPNPNQAGFSSSSEISDLAVHLELFDVPAGNYVAMAFHDENSNGQLDEDEEMVDFSNTPTSPQGERPSFENMSFQHSGNVTGVRLAVRRREQSRSGPGHPGGGMGGGRGGGGERPGGGGRPF